MLENRYQIQSIYSDRIQAGQKFISNLETNTILGNKNININITITGLYSILSTYFLNTNHPQFIDDSKLIPKYMYIYIYDDIQSTSVDNILSTLCPIGLIKKDVGQYQIYDKGTVELLHNRDNLFNVNEAQIYKLENKKNGDKFNIIIVFHRTLAEQLNLNIRLIQNSCKLIGEHIYTHNIDTYFDNIDNRIIYAIHSTYALIYDLIDTLEKFKFEIIYKNVPYIFIESNEICNITSTPSPYYVFKLNCNHNLSILALIGLIINLSDNKIVCPICRRNVKLQLRNTYHEVIPKNIIIGNVNDQCMETILSFINKNDKNHTFIKHDDCMVSTDHNQESDQDDDNKIDSADILHVIDDLIDTQRKEKHVKICDITIHDDEYQNNEDDDDDDDDSDKDDDDE